MELLIEENIGTNLSGPYIRNIYLKRATEEYEKNNVLASVTYQINAMCISFHNTFLREARNQKLDKNSFNVSTKLTEENSLINFAKKFVEGDLNSVNGEQFYNNDIKYNESDIIETCNKFPKEWTIIQLCKGFNTNSTFCLEAEILTQNSPIFLTVLHHPRQDISKIPICFRIDPSNENNIFEKFYELSKEIRDKFFFDGDDNKKNRAMYWSGMQILNESIKNIIDDLKLIFEPYLSFFIGEASDNHETQISLFKKVDEFCSGKNLSNEQNIFLSMVARRIHKLTDMNIRAAIDEIIKLGCSQNEFDIAKDIYEFLMELKNIDVVKTRYKPCILIIDELIDHFFWEMLIPDQEICRISSLRILESLYINYKNKIRDGYLKIHVLKGHYLLNADNSLNKMEERMLKFFEYWLPNWKFVAGKIPTENDLISFLTNGDVYVYCGHGSSLQFLSGPKVAKLIVNSVVFLFGCDSVRLKSDGWHSELTGSQMYFHAASCPAVIGSLIIALDFQMDNMSTKILSSWIPSNQKIHWEHIDKNAWRKGENFRKTAQTTSEKISYESSLPLILSNIRSDTSIAFYNKACFVHRGLPVWNISAE